VTGKACQLKSLQNNTGADASFPYPVSAMLLSHSLREALQKWEAEMGKGDPLADWNPYQGMSPATKMFAIGAPNLSTAIPADAPAFGLTVTSKYNSPIPGDKVVELEWAKLTAPKDPSIEPFVYHYGTPAGALASLTWGDLPASVPVTGVFPPGLYAVRAKVHMSWNNIQESNWQLFWIGDPDPLLAKLIPQGKVPYAGPGKLDFSKLSKVIFVGKGEAKLVNVSELPKLVQAAPSKAALAPRGDVGAELDALTQRLTPLQQDPEARTPAHGGAGPPAGAGGRPRA